MTIRIKCSECGVAMKIKDELAGKTGKCPKCKTAFVVPELEQDEETEPAEADGQETSEAATDDEKTHASATASDDAGPEDEYDDDGDFEDEYDDGEYDDDESDDDDEDDLVDMPMELTAAPVTTPPPEAAPPPPARDRKKASETKKGTRLSSKSAKGAKSSGSDEFDPTDVLFEDDGPPRSSDPIESDTDVPEFRPGRVGGLDDDDDEDEGPDRSSMADMFKDFTPAGGRKKHEATVDSTSVAAEALARRAEEKRTKSSEFDQVEEEEESELVEIAQAIWQQYWMYICGFFVLAVGLYFVSDIMMGSGPESDLPDLVDVEGTVKRGGQAVAGAQLLFLPADEKTEGSGGTATTDEDGEFYVLYTEDTEGLPPGTYNVTITLQGRTLFGKQGMVIRAEDQPPLNFEVE